MRPLEVVVRVRHGFAVGLEELVQLGVGIVLLWWRNTTGTNIDPAVPPGSKPSRPAGTAIAAPPSSSFRGAAAPTGGRCSLVLSYPRWLLRLEEVAEGLDVVRVVPVADGLGRHPRVVKSVLALKPPEMPQPGTRFFSMQAEKGNNRQNESGGWKKASKSDSRYCDESFLRRRDSPRFTTSRHRSSG